MSKNTKQKTEWKSIVAVLYARRHELNGLLTDEDLRVRLQFFCVYLIFTAVAAVMTVVNIFSVYRLLMYSTLIYAALNLVNVLLALISSQTEYLSRICFAVETELLFLFFVIVGQPEGFSAIWIVLLPSSGMLLYRMRYGLVAILGQFLIIVFLFWTPFGRSLIRYQGYTESFLLRFPLLYTAAALVGIFFEYIRMTTQSELQELRNKFEYDSLHDALTGLYNRFGFYSGIEAISNHIQGGGYAFAILDLDHFKSVNDRYGHLNGDIVLKSTGEILERIVGDAGWVSRWGGEEFAVFLEEEESAEALCGKMVEAFRSHTYNFDGNIFRVTISCGLILVDRGTVLSTSALVTAADKNLYTSKETGRNRLTVSRFSVEASSHPQEAEQVENTPPRKK